MSLPSVMTHTFSQVPSAEIPRSSFDLSFGHKTTFDGGFLIPFFWMEILPADTVNLSLQAFARLATPLKPVMDNIFFDYQFYFVPARLVWDNWQKFNGEQRNPGDSTDYVVPQIVSKVGGYDVGSIFDYFGLPTVGTTFGAAATISHSALPLRCYNLIYNEWYRDQNMINSVTTNTGDGPDLYTDYSLLRRGKRHDYFTSALPWPQKGTAVSLPLGTSAPVTRVSNATSWSIYNTGTNTKNSIANTLISTAAGNLGITTGGVGLSFDPNGGLIADLSTATAATINQLRQAFQIQKMYERDARGGTRYTEILRAHFGVISPDARLQRPEYLGGGSVPINVNPIAQTGGTGTTGTTTPQGNLAAMGTMKAGGSGFAKSFTEHGFILGLCMARADLTYQQGVKRDWFRRTRFDYYWPALSHIGEQAILRQEIYCVGTPALDQTVFGYQERYAEYRNIPSLITGKFRSTLSSGTLDYWHLSQKFTSPPTLNSTFINEDPPFDRVIAVPSEPDFLLDTFFSIRAARALPVYGVPESIDRF